MLGCCEVILFLLSSQTDKATMAMMMARMQKTTVTRKAIVDGDMEMRFLCVSDSVLILMIDSSFCDNCRGE